ncbi:MAG: hypothetical protein A3J53_00695 [Candidatus Harrisonbacteria bacterium RIFCSPHIGHO2_02_FULL_40_20]|nr:MAG: hypothetical protein A3J53_00695 [Candidatus Harrisonbacteria bacterium RIFCSPHIGHO2_02_FULL_40_20]
MRLIFSAYFLIIFIPLVVVSVGYATFTGLSLHNLWIDRVAHFAGGFWAAVLFLYIFREYSELKRFSEFLESWILVLVFTLGFVALIGVLWEVFEFTTHNIGTLGDTIEDLSLDLVGAAVAVILSFFYKKIDKK